jgi:RNA polymerase sigma factor for flagellar operon FliA
VDEFSTWQEQAQIANVISLDEFTESGSDIGMDHNGGTRFEQPDDAVEKQELKKKVAEAIDTLTEKERSVILLYYYEEMTLKEISRVLDVSESRVSQLHTRSIQKLKDRLGNYINIFIQ